MKNFYRITVLIALLTISGLNSLRAQRTISGTVYNNGKPAEGAIVQIDLGGSMMTSSDGKYQLVVQDSSQWLKFILFNKSRTYEISDTTSNEFDFDFDSKLPWDQKLTIQFSGMDLYIGKNLWFSVTEKDLGIEIYTERTSVEANFMIDELGIRTGKSYNIDFCIDHNDNGYYDGPPLDHAWRLELNKASSDTTLLFEHNTNFTDIFPSNDDTVNTSTQVFFIVEDMPEFPGGEQGLRNYIRQCIIYPVYAEINGIQGRVYVTFVIEKDGSVGKVNVARGVDPVLDAEAVRIVKSMPQWTPGYDDGVPVRVSYTVPINFILPTFTVLTEKTTDEFKIYPNPAKNIIHISSPDFDKFNYSIIDLSGRTILSGSSNKNSKEVKLQHISKGSYIILLNNTDTRFSKLISIE